MFGSKAHAPCLFRCSQLTTQRRDEIEIPLRKRLNGSRSVEQLDAALEQCADAFPSPATHAILTVLKAGESVFQTLH